MRTSARHHGRSRAVLTLVIGLAALALGTGTTSAPGSEGDFEVEFMSMTVDHHRSALDMGEQCVAKAARDDLQSLCQGIVAAQQAEIADLQSKLRKWYGVTKEPVIHPDQAAVLQRLRALTGRQFDRAISREFIVHHAMLLPEAERCLRDLAHHRSLRRMCDEMFDTQ